MRIIIFNVAHGFCAYAVAANGNTMLFDCGHNDLTNFYPANYLLASGCTGIERFFPLNYDEDHLSGLPRLRQLSDRIPIEILHRNTSLTPETLRRMKAEGGPIRPGVAALLEMLEAYTGGVANPPEYPGVEFATFWNSYPTFRDTNNLSLVVFVHYPGVSIVFPGDLEAEGWRELLKSAAFRDHLARVNIFVASHHGRESGYCPEVFAVCRPSVIIISDTVKEFETQENAYAQHARGILWNGKDTRYVLTTRCDGNLTITSTGQAFHIQAQC